MKTWLMIYTLVTMIGARAFAANDTPHRLLVELTDHAAREARQLGRLPDEIASFNFDKVRLVPVFHEPADFTLRESWYDLGLNHWFRLEAEAIDAEVVHSVLKHGRNVTGTYLIGTHDALLTPNDFALYNMWGLAKMHCPEAWDVQSSGSEIIITTIDTGCKITHSDLAQNIRVNPGEDLNGNGIWDPTDNNGVDDDGNAYIDDLVGWDFVSHTPDTARWAEGEEYAPADNLVYPDIHGHGTHVMGTASARTNNGAGVAAASWNVKALPLRAGYAWIDGGGTLRGSGFTDDFAAAVAYATENGARIISISFGGSGVDPAYEVALQYARDNNVLVFASAGNSNNTNLVYPAAYPHVISVAATDSTDHKASFSTFGTWVDVCAPGVYIWSLQPNNFYRPNDYAAWNGTSMASPNAASVAALVLSYAPQLTDDQLQNLIVSTCDNIDALNPTYAGQLGTGRVNAFAALTALCDTFSLFPPELTIKPSALGVTLSWKKVACAVDYEITVSPATDGVYVSLGVTTSTTYVDPVLAQPLQFYRVTARRP